MYGDQFGEFVCGYWDLMTFVLRVERPAFINYSHRTDNQHRI